MAATGPDDNSDELTISPETVFYIIVKAREFDEKVEPTDPDSGSNPSDDRDIDVLEDEPDDPVEQELEAAIGGLNVDEQIDLLALTWLGRAEFSSFAEAREATEEMRDRHIVSYLMGTPKLGDFLEEALTQLGYSLDDFAINRL